MRRQLSGRGYAVNRIRFLAVTLVVLTLSCAPREAEDPGLAVANVSAAVRRQRATIIRDVAREQGITNGLMVAMLAEEETMLAHCASEYRPSCPGPVHTDCSGSPVLSGSGDGACHLDRGGLGMFQIDDGTEADTVRVHGERVLSIRGNTEVAIGRLIDKVRRSRWTTNASTRELAIAWINERRIDDANWDNYIRTLVRYWNGCPENGACWSNRYPKYNNAARTLYAEFGHDFWYGATPTPVPPEGGGWLSAPLSPRVTSYVSHARGSGWARYDCTTLTRANHKGTDFGVARGTPVQAAAAGTVIESVTGCPAEGSLGSSCGGSFGNHVIIRHGDLYATLYAHLSPSAGQVKVGASVDCGQLIGLSGNSGKTSGPHLHFEVRSNVTAPTRAGYFAGKPVDPWGGSCSTQADTLWVGGGAPQQACVGGPPADRDDAVLARATHPNEISVASGTRVTQTFTWRNTGTTTWTAGGYVMRHTSGAFSNVSEVPLPSGTMVRPGDTVALSVEVTAPSAVGLHQGTWRLARTGGAVFGRDGTLKLRVTAAPRACRSATLGRTIDSGACVQVSYPGCGMTSCAWYACSDGAWLCMSGSDCGGEAIPHPSCCVAGADGGTCTNSVCGQTGQICASDEGCCEGFQCVAGACQDPAMCKTEQTSCTSGLECCGGLSCLENTFGSSARECCVGWTGGYCRNSDDCCGEMTCSGNQCVRRRAGESCASHWDCEGALLCTSGTCSR